MSVHRTIEFIGNGEGTKDIENSLNRLIDVINELEQITKWLEANANSSKFRNVYEMLERFKLEFNHLLKEEQTFNSGVWATIQCLAIDHEQPICASFVANDMRITKKEAIELQAQSGYYDELMNEVIDCLND